MEAGASRASAVKAEQKEALPNPSRGGFLFCLVCFLGSCATMRWWLSAAQCQVVSWRVGASRPSTPRLWPLAPRSVLTKMKLCKIRLFFLFYIFCFLRQDEVAIEVSAQILIQQSRKGGITMQALPTTRMAALNKLKKEEEKPQSSSSGKNKPGGNCISSNENTHCM